MLLFACNELELKIEIPYLFKLQNQQEIEACARISNLGSKNGMLIFNSFDEIRSNYRDIQKANFAFSIIDELSPTDVFDLSAYIEMFNEWGWSGSTESIPIWMS